MDEKILTEALKLKVKYDARISRGVIVKQVIDEIIKTIPVGPNPELKTYSFTNAIVVYNMIVVYRDVYGKTYVVLPENLNEGLNIEEVLNKVNVVQKNKIDAMKELIYNVVTEKNEEASMIYADNEMLSKKSAVEYIISKLVSSNKITYYTENISLNEFAIPKDGFYLTDKMLIVTSDKKLAEFTVRHAIEIQGIEVFNIEQFRRVFKKLSSLYGIEHILEEQYGNNVLSCCGMTVIPEIPIYLEGTVVYFKDFSVKIHNNEIVFEKGIAYFNYGIFVASPDIWKLLTSSPP